MRICAIDQSYTDSGVALYLEGEENYFSIIPPKGMTGVERLKWIQTTIKELLLSQNIKLVVFEDYAFSQVHMAHMAGELGGMLKLLCLDLGIPFFQMPIGVHKAFTTGKGNTKKEMMLKEVYKSYGVDTNDNNIADAISILKTCLGYFVSEGKLKGNLTKKQLETVKKLKDRIKTGEAV